MDPLDKLFISMQCTCDFCTGKKRWEDNWCGRCAKVKLEPPKWWENLDICDACEKEETDAGTASRKRSKFERVPALQF